MKFNGSKVALIYEDKLIMQLRDNKPGLFNANMWDFPGGGSKDNETPTECAIREVHEEFGITINTDLFMWEKEYPAQKDPKQISFFLVASISKKDIDSIHFGTEGQRWELMDYDTFFNKDDVINALKGRFRDYLDSK